MDITIRNLDPFHIGLLAYLAEILPFDPDDDGKYNFSMNNHHIEALSLLLTSFCIALECDRASCLIDQRKELLELLRNFYSKLDEFE